MGEYDQYRSEGMASELLTALPFMAEFPFGNYEIVLVEQGDDFIKLGVSPILIEEFGELGKVEMINFYYTEDDSDIIISLYRDDIEWIAEEARNIKKIDSLRKMLDDALSSNDLLLKTKAIKAGQKFSKLIDCDNLRGVNFTELLDEFLIMYDTKLSSKLKLGLHKLSEATLKSTEFSEKQFTVVKAFLNFQIHYAKILLGIVIAAKIY